ncbi:hypothetical protein Zmor_006170 [Zophobas morio]|uniref:THAP-type domain-containing protein n=1 Tax=Zophobas morio TaxID=2755281 RepID=A0AA38IUG1_9CUCU|nr:hypothetical protein Zmor_006170 [Zophobas morio]
MVISCSAYGCTNRQKKGVDISFHSFPSDTILRQQWIIAMKRQNFQPSKYSKLCSEHFQKDDFIHNFGLKTLKKDVIPTIFKFPPHLMKKEPMKRSTRLQRTAASTSFSVGHAPPPLASTSFTNAEEVNSNPELEQCVPVTDMPEEPAAMPELPPASSFLQCRKRKRDQPVYMGDFSQ